MNCLRSMVTFFFFFMLSFSTNSNLLGFESSSIVKGRLEAMSLTVVWGLDTFIWTTPANPVRNSNYDFLGPYLQMINTLQQEQMTAIRYKWENGQRCAPFDCGWTRVNCIGLMPRNFNMSCLIALNNVLESWVLSVLSVPPFLCSPTTLHAKKQHVVAETDVYT